MMQPSDGPRDGGGSVTDGLAVVLVRPRFPENIGAAARACANFGCSRLVLVAPERWEEDKALPLATPKGADILRRLEIFDDLPAALAGFAYAFGTTARTGGWRRDLVTPAQAGPAVAERLREGGGWPWCSGPRTAACPTPRWSSARAW
jgi:tRNA/rRNA methyltransferase